MSMHSPPHPGEFIREVYLEPFEVSTRHVARLLDVAPSTFSRLVRGLSDITPEMALRLSKTLGRTPESWLAMQHNHNLWSAKQNLDLRSVGKLDISAA